MSDSVENASNFDVEAQETLLGRGSEETRNININVHARQTLQSVGRRLILLIRSTRFFKLEHIAQSQGRKKTDVVKNATFDVEAPLLATPAEAETTNINARLTWQTIILLHRSAELFKSGANYAPDISSSSPTSASYVSISISTDQVSANDDSTHGDIFTAHSTADKYKRRIEAQHIQKKDITEIVKKKNLKHLRSFGGVEAVAKALNTDLEKGIPGTAQGVSQCMPSQLSQVAVTLLYSFLGACNNYTIFLLSTSALLSLGFGITEEGSHVGWLNGAVLIFTIFVLVISTTIRKWWEKRSYEKLENCWQSKGRKIEVTVVRGGDFQCIHEIDLEVGDIAVLRKGVLVSADGLFVTGPALEIEEAAGLITTINEENPFLFYGSRVINGNAWMLVTSTRMDTVWGEMMSQAIVESAENKCKFESYFHRLTNCMQISGLMISIPMIIVLFLRYKAGKFDDERRYRPDSKGEPTRLKTIMDALKGIVIGSKGTARVLTTLLSLTLLGITEGMAFVISVATIIWSRKILAEYNASVRDHLACINMANATTICTDKFGGLTLNEMEIDKFCVGDELVSESSVVASNVLEGFCDGIGTQFLIPSTECESKLVPLILWAEVKLGMKRESVIEQCKRIIMYSGCNPFQECCQTMMEKNGNEGYLHCKGPPKDILSLCSHHYDIDGRIQEIDKPKRRTLVQAVEYMRAEEAQVIGYACKRISDFDEGSVEPNNLIYLGMISLRRTTMEDIERAVSTLRKGGIRTILIASGDDDIEVLKTISKNCGIFAPDSDDLVLTAEEFRALTDEEKKNKVEKICIMGNCLPSDKILFIKYLRERGQVVVLVAQKTTDAPALKQADIGITLGTWSSQIARECSAISIWDIGNCFGFVANVVEKGRCFQANIRKFIQLQLIITISSSLINFTGIVFLGDAPLTAAQLFWLNLVVAFAGGLALLTGPPTKTLMTMLPPKSSAEMINKAMWRNIAIQASYQTTIFVTLQHKGHAILGTSGGRVKSMIYNGFFLCQLFNKFIAREPEKKNIFGGLFHKNWWFWVAVVLFLVCQAASAVAEEFLGGSPGLTLKLWGACLLIGLVSWLLDLAGKSASYFTARWAADQG